MCVRASTDRNCFQVIEMNELEVMSRGGHTAPSTWLMCNKGWLLCSGGEGSGLDSQTGKHLTFCQGQICLKREKLGMPLAKPTAASHHYPPRRLGAFLCVAIAGVRWVCCMAGICVGLGLAFSLCKMGVIDELRASWEMCYDN